MAVLGCAALSISALAKADEWVFVWVGATPEGWTVVQGTAIPKLGQEELHFDLMGANSVKYTVDAQLKKDGTAEAGLAGLGNAYGGITILRGKFGKKSIASGCNVEVLQVQNEFNSLSIGRFGAPGCKR
jgi:hypothetical protein